MRVHPIVALGTCLVLVAYMAWSEGSSEGSTDPVADIKDEQDDRTRLSRPFDAFFEWLKSQIRAEDFQANRESFRESLLNNSPPRDSDITQELWDQWSEQRTELANVLDGAPPTDWLGTNQPLPLLPDALLFPDEQPGYP